MLGCFFYVRRYKGSFSHKVLEDLEKERREMEEMFSIKAGEEGKLREKEVLSKSVALLGVSQKIRNSTGHFFPIRGNAEDDGGGDAAGAGQEPVRAGEEEHNQQRAGKVYETSGEIKT